MDATNMSTNMSATMDYQDFIAAKVAAAPEMGFSAPLPLHDSLFPHQRAIVDWAITRGRAAIFAAFGLGKTRMQIELARQTCAHTERPLPDRRTVGGEGRVPPRRRRDGREHHLHPPHRGSRRDRRLPHQLRVRQGRNPDGTRKVDPREFDGASLDEASCLRGFGGTKTFREFMALFAGDDRRDMSQRVTGEAVRYRFVATATPSPNDFIELLAYAAFLDVMDVSTAKTRFFQRDSEHADELTIHPHKVKEFWLWVSTWATFVTKPSDVSPDFSDDGYALPPLTVRWHELPTEHLARTQAAAEKLARRKGRAQIEMFADAAKGITEAAGEARATIAARVAKAREIMDAEPGEHFLLWHDLEDERHEIEKAIPGVVSVYGSQGLDEREAAIVGFSEGAIKTLAAKPVMLGSGVNFQRFCRRAIFIGVGYKFNDFIQAVHRIHRFLQPGEVVIDIIYTEAQRGIRSALEQKWAQHNELVAQMIAIVREHGLGCATVADALADKVTCERQDASGDGWELVNNDSVDEFRGRPSNSLGLIVTSIPFSGQYKYSDSYRDMGHVDTNAHFWAQMDYLTPNLFRCLKPGRMACIHVKDRIVPGGMTGLGFQTVYPFHADAIRHYTEHGFAYMGMITVVTDVVRENAQTYRLGWTEHSKDSTKMGVGMPEYILLFRKPPTSSERSYADEPVTHSKERYTRGRWQTDAHAFWRSCGDRFLTPADFDGLDYPEMFQRFAQWTREKVYDHASNVKVADALGDAGKLPSGFMLLQPQSWHPDAWTDVARMRTLNTLQAAQDRIQHLCPLQFDIVDRLIERFSNPGDIVCDPFGGLGTVVHEAVKLGRKGLSCELSPVYWGESVRYLKALQAQMSTRTLFDLEGITRMESAAGVPAEAAAEAAAEAPEVANETGPAVATAKPKRAPRKAAKKEEAA
jgi:DNA modification methylase